MTFAGQQDDVAPWLAALDVFALPSYANEGVPQALLQAMFARRALRHDRRGRDPGDRPRRRDRAIVARRGRRRARGRIDRLLADPAEASRLALRAREFVVPRYGLDTMLDRMEAVFRRALAERSEADRP